LVIMLLHYIHHARTISQPSFCHWNLLSL
jgi:hypothetical protein